MRKLRTSVVVIFLAAAMLLTLAPASNATTCDRGGPCDHVLAIVFSLTCKTVDLFCNVT